VGVIVVLRRGGDSVVPAWAADFQLMKIPTAEFKPATNAVGQTILRETVMQRV
jgi:hypothetical protein